AATIDRNVSLGQDIEDCGVLELGGQLDVGLGPGGAQEAVAKGSQVPADEYDGRLIAFAAGKGESMFCLGTATDKWLVSVLLKQCRTGATQAEAGCRHPHLDFAVFRGQEPPLDGGPALLFDIGSQPFEQDRLLVIFHEAAIVGVYQ